MPYTTSGELRERLGSCGEGYADTVLDRLIKISSNFIDFVTGLWFEERALVIKIDGRGTDILQVPVPIIDITKIEIVDQYYSPGSSEIELDSVSIYNRHLTQNLTNPDDRQNPKISFVTASTGPNPFGVAFWPDGYQNIQLTGSFGYTEYDPDNPTENPPGITPLMIKEVCERLVIRDLPTVPGAASGGPHDPSWYERWMRSQGRVTKEKVRDQEIDYAAPNASGGGNIGGIITGDPFIDMILIQHSKTALMRSA